MKTITYDESQWQLVPREPNEAMVAATRDVFAQTNSIILHHAARTGTQGLTPHPDGSPVVRAYRAMLAAAPEPETVQHTEAAVNGAEREHFKALIDSIGQPYAGSLRADLLAAFDAALAAPRSEADRLDAVSEIAAERQRQISVEGWTPEHDDEHDKCELAEAAACYAVGQWVNPGLRYASGADVWPWDQEWWKPGPPRRMLIKAGALIVAEIERIDRDAARSTAPKGSV